MANDEKPGTNLASGSVIMVALVSTGFYFFHREAPLVDMRPLAEARLEEHAATQEIEARLWQDPIEAVDKSRDRSGTREVEQKCQASPRPEAPPCQLPLDKNDKKTLVLGITVPGAPYPEDVERRRRTRYAVLAGLERAGFAPKDRRHIGYFVWTQPPAAAPFLSEWPPGLPLLACDTPSAQRVACLSTASAHSASSVLLFGVLQGTRLNSVQSLPVSSPADPAIIPYENFKKVLQPDEAERDNTTDSILILWLKEDFFIRQPLTALDSLVGLLKRDQDPAVKFIGPSSSDMLHEMVNEATQNGLTCDIERRWKYLQDVKFYAYLASAPDEYLFGKLQSSCGPLQDYFEKLGIHLQRTISTEDTLAAGIRDELKLRRIDPASDHIALISEWDTLYGQTLPKAVARAFAPIDPTSIHKFTYLRGLDGLLPSSAGKEDTKQEKSTTTGTKPGGSSDFFKIEGDTQSLERPIGESQYDYLRRTSAQLHKVDDKLRNERDEEGREKKIKAIGILGGDVFDKLLILRALRPEFPEALFFTTDFDEAFTIKSELPFTRNLIISSSFGPNLNERLQGDIPFFRDTGQASAFLATQLALGLPKSLETPNSSGTDLASQLLIPRLFEVTRTGGILQFAWGPQPSSKETHGPKHESHPPQQENNPLVANATALAEGRSASPCLKGAGRINCGVGQPIDVEQKADNPADPKPCWNGDDMTNCSYIQPVDPEELKNLSNPGNPKVIEKLFPAIGEDSRETLVMGLALGALLGVVALAFRYVRKHAFVEVVLLILGLGVGALICAYWEPIAQYLTENGKGEPIAIADGVSVWPTILLRGLGIILSVYFFLCIVGGLHNNLEEIAGEMELRPKPEPLLRQLAGIQEILTFLKWLRSLFRTFRHNHGTARNVPLEVEAAWRTYLGRERIWPRCIRAALYTVLMILFFRYVLAPIFGMPTHPERGVRAFDVSGWTIYFDVRLMLFLTFFVFDATLSCLLFVNKLRCAQSLWPQATIGVYKGRLRLQTKLVHHWIDLDFVAKRTKCIGSLIYFPFVLIALLILSRSTIFANYAPSLTILVAQGISLTFVFSCAIMLCWAARATRDLAKENLTEGIIRAKDAESNPRLAEQLETLLVRVAQLNGGAFSPFSQQPLVKALLFPLSSAGWVALIESGTLVGL